MAVYFCDGYLPVLVDWGLLLLKIIVVLPVSVVAIFFDLLTIQAQQFYNITDIA